VNTECKAILAVTSFHNSFGQFEKPAWCSNSSKFVRSRVNLQISKLSGLCRGFYWSLWTRSQTFTALVPKWCWQVLLADPATRGRGTRQFPPKFSKTCLVVSSVEYISSHAC